MLIGYDVCDKWVDRVLKELYRLPVARRRSVLLEAVSRYYDEEVKV